MADAHVVVVGAGPRALNVIERLAWKMGREVSLPPLTVHVVDPGEPCAGAHPASQSWHLLTNTLASQVTMFSPEDLGNTASPARGPSFTEWARDEGYRRFCGEFVRNTMGEPIGDLDYLPRAMLGEYLAFAYRTILASAPRNLTIIHHRAEAVNITGRPPIVHLDNGLHLPCNAVVIATGHCETLPSSTDLNRESFVRQNASRNRRLSYIRNVYPTSKLDVIDPSAIVAVQGLGLTAYDVITDLTLGRGGRFEGDGGAIRYLASGREPRILLFSRQSLPYNARGVNEKGVDGGHKARFLTAEAIAAIRTARMAQTGDGRLDFQSDILPLLRRDMVFAHRCAVLRTELDPEGFIPTEAEEALIDEIFMPPGLFDCADLEEFRRRATDFVRDDLRESMKGNVSSPRKAATDCIRDLRAGLSEAIEFAGLTPESHRYVAETFIPLTNRITFGPPLRRNAELLALIEAGVVGWAGGPGAAISADVQRARFVVRTPFPMGISEIAADVLIIARVTGHRPIEDVRPLSRRLVESGVGRPFCNGSYHPYGLDVDRRMRVISVDGVPSDHMWAVGYVTEGARFHTHALPRPGRTSTQLLDAARLVDDLVTTVLLLNPVAVHKRDGRNLQEADGQ